MRLKKEKEIDKSKMSLTNSSIRQPSYDRKFGASAPSRIVHLGVGGFHRAHQALYTHLLGEQNNCLDWSICGVGLQEQDKKMFQVMHEQQGLYSLVSRGKRSHFENSFLPYKIEIDQESEEIEDVRVIGSVTEYCLATGQKQELLELIAEDKTKIISLTVTESGYYLTSDQNLDLQNPIIVRDLDSFNAGCPDLRTAIGCIVAGLEQRKEQNKKGLTILSCDNIPENGHKLRKAVLDFIRASSKVQKLLDYAANVCSFPNSMVDCITPVTTNQVMQHLNLKHHVQDKWPVLCECYHSWVIEDTFINGRPKWEMVGAKFVKDVKPYELMKLRLLNGAHSCLAYVSCLMNIEKVDQAMAHPFISHFIADYMSEMLPAVPDVHGIDLKHYCQILIDRFSNQSISDQISRLCIDGSSKFSFFVSEAAQILIESGQSTNCVAFALAAWIQYLAGQYENGELITVMTDPRKDELMTIAKSANPCDVIQIVMPLFHKTQAAVVKNYLCEIRENGINLALKQFLSK